MIMPLFIANIKKHWVLLLIFFSVLTMYTTIMMSMFNPNDMDELMEVAALMPEGLIQAMGFSDMITGFTAYLASWLYGMLMLAFPMVYAILLGHKLIAKMVDNSSMTYLLSTPHSRCKIIFTQGIYAIVSMMVLFSLLFMVGVGTSAMILPGELEIANYFKLNVTTMLVNIFILMVVFLCSAIFNDAKYSVSFGSSIPIVFLLFNMLGNASKDAEILFKFTPYGYYNPVDVVGGMDTLFLNGMYIVGIIVLFAASIIIFSKKKLPL